MNNYTINDQDQKKAENIRRQYVSKNENKMEQLSKLDAKVKAPGKVAANIVGIAGVLLMGAGMAFIMVWSSMTTGLILSIPGMIIALLAYPLYTLITNGRKKKYADEIMRMSAAITDME